jgi:hypothetical protein
MLGQLCNEERINELAGKGMAGYMEAVTEKIDTITDLNMARWWADRNGWDFRAKFAADVAEKVDELRETAKAEAAINAAAKADVSGKQSPKAKWWCGFAFGKR